MPAADMCRLLGCREASFYLWKKRCGKLGLTQIQELRQLPELPVKRLRQIHSNVKPESPLPLRRLNLRHDGLFDSADFRLVSFVKGPLLSALCLDEARRFQNPHVFAECRLRDPKLVSNRARAYPVLDQVAVNLGRKVRFRILQPVQNLLTPVVGKRVKK
jgi:hypothetical protein